MFLAFDRGHFWGVTVTVTQWLFGMYGSKRSLPYLGFWRVFFCDSKLLVVVFRSVLTFQLSHMSQLWVIVTSHWYFLIMAHARIWTGFDESFPLIGIVFVIWRAEYSLLSTLEQLLYLTERSFWLVGRFVDTENPQFFNFLPFWSYWGHFLCHSD